MHTAEEAAELTARVDAISRALTKLPPFIGDVRRGATLTPDLWDFYAPGRTVQELAFTSTTRLAEGFTGNTQFRIASVTGKDISAYSVFPEEQEVLFDRGTEFLVLGHEIVNDRHIIQMMEVARGH